MLRRTFGKNNIGKISDFVENTTEIDVISVEIGVN